jgi:RHS repeat-associated protein
VNGAPQSVNWESNLNLAGYNGWSYNYDAENRLISVGGIHSATFLYDGVGRCVRRIIDGATTVLTYDQWTPIAEWDSSGNLIATNVYGLGDDEIVYRSAGSTQLFYKSDPMGNVKFILDQNGNGIEKYKYDAFGSPTITDWSGNSRSSSAYGNRFMFSGRDYMIALALYDMRSRVYDPVMGRFYQTDPIGFQGDSWNLYRFCGNNPMLGGDPFGLDGADFTFTLGVDPGWFFSSGSGADASSWNYWNSDYGSSLSFTDSSTYFNTSGAFTSSTTRSGISQGLEAYRAPISGGFSLAAIKSQVATGLLQAVPGKLYWDNTVSSYQAGNYFYAAGWTVDTLADDFLFALTLGEGQLLKQAFRASAAISVEREITLQQGQYINRVWDSRWTPNSRFSGPIGFSYSPGGAIPINAATAIEGRGLRIAGVINNAERGGVFRPTQNIPAILKISTKGTDPEIFIAKRYHQYLELVDGSLSSLPTGK